MWCSCNQKNPQTSQGLKPGENVTAYNSKFTVNIWEARDASVDWQMVKTGKNDKDLHRFIGV